jgi:hypothetical protein
MPHPRHPAQSSRRRAKLIAFVIVLTACAFTPPALAADGYLFWSNSDDATIGRAERDGTHVDQHFATAPSRTRHVAVSQGRV